MTATTDKQPDQNRIVASLAAECHVPIGDMAALYDHERAELAARARVSRYVHIFAIRNVLEVMRQRAVAKKALAPAEPAQHA